MDELTYPSRPPGDKIDVSANAKAKGRLFLVNGPLPVRGQIIALNGAKSSVMWADAPYDCSNFGGQVSRVVVPYPRILADDPWVDQIQGSPPEVQDKRSAAQKAIDEAARLVALAASPLGGAYRLHYLFVADSYGGGYYTPICAVYVGPASAVIEA